MKRFTVAGRAAIIAKNWYAGLSLALTLPDICGSMEDPGPGKSTKRYIAWCEKWLVPRFGGELTAEDIFQLRCSLVHSGSAEIAKGKIKKYRDFEFFDDTTQAHLNFFGSVEINGEEHGNFVQLSAELFSGAVFDAVDEWLDAAKTNRVAVAEMVKLLSIRSSGYSRGPIQFGDPDAPPKEGSDIIKSRVASDGAVAIDAGPAEMPYSIKVPASKAVEIAASILSAADEAYRRTGATVPKAARATVRLHEVLNSDSAFIIPENGSTIARFTLGIADQALSVALDSRQLRDLARGARQAANQLDAKKWTS